MAESDLSSLGILGVKLGMSRVFDQRGASIPVTAVYAQPNHVCQVKTAATDGYGAAQLAAGSQKPQRVSKALRGHYSRARVPLGRRLAEFRLSSTEKPQVGDAIGVRQFVEGQKVDLTGISKGRGFTGGIKRWNFASQDATHGNSVSHRHLGSTGQCQSPGRVFKGKKMPGHSGAARTTVLRLEVVEIDEKNHLLWIKGAVPGANGGWVIVRPSVKQTAAERDRIIKRQEEKAAARTQAETEARPKEQGVEETKAQHQKSSAQERKEKPASQDNKADTERKEQKIAPQEGAPSASSDAKAKSAAQPQTAGKEAVNATDQTNKDQAKTNTSSKPDGSKENQD